VFKRDFNCEPISHSINVDSYPFARLSEQQFVNESGLSSAH